MTGDERAVLARIRALAPAKATDLGHRCGTHNKRLCGALVTLEAKGLARMTMNYSNPNKQQPLWETAA